MPSPLEACSGERASLIDSYATCSIRLCTACVCRKGRRHGGKLVIRPTDFSQVVDLHDVESHPAAVRVHLPSSAPLGTAADSWQREGPLQEQQQQQQEGEGEQGQGQGQEALRCFTFPRHPGLAYFPQAIPPEAQLELMAAALRTYPEPPAHTNHWAAYGPVAGIFDASQQGLHCCLAKAHPVPACATAGPCSGGVEGEAASGCSAAASSCGAAPSGCSAAASSSGAAPSGCGAAASSHGACSTAPSEVLACSTRAGGSSCAQSSSSCAGSGAASTSGGHPSSRPFSECWSHTGAGPAATHLLRKLRWACLGPNFNWTRRVYDPSMPHRWGAGMQWGTALSARPAHHMAPACMRVPSPTRESQAHHRNAAAAHPTTSTHTHIQAAPPRARAAGGELK